MKTKFYGIIFLFFLTLSQLTILSIPPNQTVVEENYTIIPLPMQADTTAPTIHRMRFWMNNTVFGDRTTANSSFDLGQQTKQNFPDGVFKIEVTASEVCNSCVCTLINTGVDQRYTIGMPKHPYVQDGTLWYAEGFELKQPEIEKTISIRNGIYDIEINLTDLAHNSNVTRYKNAFYISSEVAKKGVDPLQLGLIIGAIAGVGFAITFLIVKKKRSQRSASESDLEMTDGPSKKKKKGKVYSGASALGRASGQQAEMLKQRRDGVSTSKQTLEINSSNTNSKHMDGSSPSAISSAAAKMSKQTMVSKDKIPESDKDIEELLKTEQSSKMKLKQAEASVDVRRKMDFSLSKVDSLNQNLNLMNIILDQTKNLEKETRNCDVCGHEIPVIWSQCPYCILNTQKDTIKIKMEQSSKIGQDMMCPTCKKLLNAQWPRCPYCFVKDRGL